MAFSDPITGGGGTLQLASIHSPNFASGTAGWTINKDGSAEFSNATIRNSDIVSGTQLFYDGTPASGNLIGSITSAAGTDDFGNAFLKGFTDYFNIGPSTRMLAVQLAAGQITFSTAASSAGPYTTPAIQALLQSDSLADKLTLQASTLLNLVSSQLLIATAETAPATAALAEIQGAVTASPVSAWQPGGFSAAETWHALPLASGWSATAGTSGPSYKLTALDELHIIGDISGGTIANGTTLLSPALAAAYQPSGGGIQQVNVMIVGQSAPIAPANTLTPRMFYQTGQLTLENIPANTTRIAFNALLPLDL